MVQFRDNNMSGSENMGQQARVIETEGIIKNHHLVVDESLPIEEQQKVRVFVLYDQEAEVSEKSWMKAAMKGGSFDFLSDEEEDIYSLEDGVPLNE